MKIFVGISENNNPRQLHSFFSDSEAMTHFFLIVWGIGFKQRLRYYYISNPLKI